MMDDTRKITGVIVKLSDGTVIQFDQDCETGKVLADTSGWQCPYQFYRFSTYIYVLFWWLLIGTAHSWILAAAFGAMVFVIAKLAEDEFVRRI